VKFDQVIIFLKKISFNGKVRSALQQGQSDNKPRGIKTGSSPQTFIDFRSKERKSRKTKEQKRGKETELNFLITIKYERKRQRQREN
jgi:hypothetical protein